MFKEFCFLKEVNGYIFGTSSWNFSQNFCVAALIAPDGGIVGRGVVELVKTQCGPTIDPQLLGSMVYFYVEQFWYENIITKKSDFQLLCCNRCTIIHTRPPSKMNCAYMSTEIIQSNPLEIIQSHISYFSDLQMQRMTPKCCNATASTARYDSQAQSVCRRRGRTSVN